MPAHASRVTHGMQPMIVSTVKRQNGMRDTPAGNEMNVRMIGSTRAMSTAHEPYFSNQRSALSRRSGVMCSQCH